MVVILLCIPFSIMAYPIHIINMPLCIWMSSLFAYALWSLIGLAFSLSITMEGKNIMGSSNYFVISNHQGSADFILINEIARKNGMIGHLKYTLKDGLWILPDDDLRGLPRPEEIFRE